MLRDRRLLLLLLVVIAVRVPFLHHPVQGDDLYYLAGAMHGQIDPWHPHHAQYAFQGRMVDMRGHPHPPLNAWILTGALAASGDVREFPFHLVYLGLSLVAAVGLWLLAVRFSPRPLAASLLAVATPAFLVNGNSFEADLPLFACWTLGIALFVHAVDRRSATLLAAAGAVLFLAGLAAYQSVVAIPILWLYLWRYGRGRKAAWAVALAPAVGLVSYQLLELFTTGALPVTRAAGYFSEYGLQRLEAKFGNALALAAHLGWVVGPLAVALAFQPRRRWWWAVPALAAAGGAALDANPLFWLSLACGSLVLVAALEAEERFLGAWVLLFFSAALVLFFAGSARYLLPLAAPVALLAAARMRFAPVVIGAQFAVGLLLAAANQQHWQGYRDFVASLERDFAARRVWINGEWGLRFYSEARGGLPLLLGQSVRPGDVVVESKLGYPVTFTTGGGRLTPLASTTIQPAVPLRLIGLGSKSAWSVARPGFRPFDISSAPADELTARLVVASEARLSVLTLGAPEAGQQIVRGFYQAENGARWMDQKGAVLLKGAPGALEVELYVPALAPARRVVVRVDGKAVIEKTLAGPGLHTLRSGPLQPGAQALVEIETDRTFRAPGDGRRLALVVRTVAFR